MPNAGYSMLVVARCRLRIEKIRTTIIKNSKGNRRFAVSQDLQRHSLAGFSNIGLEVWRKTDLGAIKWKIFLEMKASVLVYIK